MLVLGATGVSGRIAVALAARMGAGRVIAAGRNRAILDQLGATATVALGGPDDAAALADAAGPDGIHVIIDYLWGHPTEAAIAAITRRGLAHTAPRVRLVEVGQMAGPTICLPADVLRSSGLEILGSGPGTIPLAKITGAIPEFMAIAAAGDLPIDLDEVPLAEVGPAWQHTAAAGGPSFGPDHEPACGVQNGRNWTALILIRIQPETTAQVPVRGPRREAPPQWRRRPAEQHDKPLTMAGAKHARVVGKRRNDMPSDLVRAGRAGFLVPDVQVIAADQPDAQHNPCHGHAS